MDKVEGIGLAMLDSKLDLEQYRIPDLPASMYYIPNFITPALEVALLSKASLSQSIIRLPVYSLAPTLDPSSHD